MIGKKTLKRIVAGFTSKVVRQNRLHGILADFTRKVQQLRELAAVNEQTIAKRHVKAMAIHAKNVDLRREADSASNIANRIEALVS